MGFNFLLRLRLAYWCFVSDKRGEELGGDAHINALLWTWLIIGVFLFGIRSLFYLLIGLPPLFSAYASLSFIALIAGVIVYLGCIRNRYYLLGKQYLDGLDIGGHKSICVKNGLLLVFVSVVPQIVTLLIMVGHS